ncbi:unannotated protein [freshwater metagenome]|uniref:Unannotated protein n=1 Tax=freshwater metagenome TaxID=449393 RepID=A0A6J7J501_9ZZZZ
MAHAAEEPDCLGALAPLDVHHLAPVEYRNLNGLAGDVAQLVEHRASGVVQVEMRLCTGAEFVHRESEPVGTGLGVLLE